LWADSPLGRESVIAHVPTTRLVALCLLLLAGVSVIIAGCSSNNAGESTTTVSNTAATDTTLPQLLSETEAELARNYNVQRELAKYLTKQKVAETDARMGVLYGLQARTQALSCRDALDGGSLEVADSAMLDVYQAMDKARVVAAGTVTGTLADARAIIQTLGAPSYAPGAAVSLLDRFIAALAPLLDEAAVLMSAPTTLSSTTST
jgi:hypothetical protein